MSDARILTAIPAIIEGECLVIPQGMRPVFVHELNGQMLAYVEGWSAAAEYDATRFDLYVLSSVNRFLVSSRNNGEPTTQTWYADFGKPTSEAMRESDGGLRVRPC